MMDDGEGARRFCVPCSDSLAPQVKCHRCTIPIKESYFETPLVCVCCHLLFVSVDAGCSSNSTCSNSNDCMRDDDVDMAIMRLQGALCAECNGISANVSAHTMFHSEHSRV